MAEMSETILALLEIISEYVLGSLLAIAIMGDSLYSNFREKIMWCLGVLDALLMVSFTPSTLE
ncbi:14286_t:CDS:1, partial [Funneliformis caledonium]